MAKTIVVKAIGLYSEKDGLIAVCTWGKDGLCMFKKSADAMLRWGIKYGDERPVDCTVTFQFPSKKGK
jgi:hypothetical protein